MEDQSFEELLQEARIEVRDLEIKKENKKRWLIISIITLVNLLLLIIFKGTEGLYLFIQSIVISQIIALAGSSIIGTFQFEEWNYQVKVYRTILNLLIVSQVGSLILLIADLFIGL